MTYEESAASRLDLAFAGLPEATLVVDEAGRLCEVNDAAVTLLGPAISLAVIRREPVAHALPWLRAGVDQVLSGADEAGLEAGLQGERPEAIGHGHELSARLRRLGPPGLPARGAVIVLQDVGVSRAQEGRQRSVERLAALGTLASGLAHEVNNPLSCVLAGLAFVEREHTRLAGVLGPGELREATLAMNEAREAAQRVGRVVRSLQSFGQSSAPFLAEVEVAPALEKAAALARPDLVDRASLQVEVVAPGARVRASEALLVELFLALLTNAAQAIPRGPPEDHLVRAELDVIEGEAWVVVSDTGVGITGEVLERAFDPFFTTRPGHGAGLGLSVSHGIVTALGGRLTLGGMPGRGTTATVRLPLAA